MRIFTGVLSQGYGGAERNSLHIACKLAERGHEVHYYFTEGNRIGAAARKSGLPILSVPHGLKYLSPTGIGTLRSYMKKHSFHVVHSNDWHSLGGIVAPAVRLTNPRPVFVNTRRIGCGSKKKDIYHKWTFRQLDAFLVLSQRMANDAKMNFAIDPNKVRILYNAVELEMYTALSTKERGKALRAQCGFSQDDLVILCAGRLIENKRQLDLIQGLTPLLREEKAIKLVIAGEADQAQYQNAINEAASQANTNQGNVLLTGFVEDIPAAMQAADIIIMPSLNEAFGMVLIEGMAAGCVPIATPNEATSEIIDDGVDGFVVPRPDSSELIAVIRNLHSNRSLRKRMAQRALDKVKERFDRERQLDFLEKLYQELVTGKGNQF